MKGTTEELAKAYGVSVAQMNGALMLLKKCKKVEIIEKIAKEPGIRGRKKIVYQLIDIPLPTEDEKTSVEENIIEEQKV